MPKAQGESSIAEIFGFFLRLGLTGFGGPAAHIALMEREAVERRGWVSREQFLDLLRHGRARHQSRWTVFP